MTENVIYKLSKQFALRIIKLYSYLYDQKKEYVISKQLYRSGTSIGANIAESIFARRRKEMFFFLLHFARLFVTLQPIRVS